MPKTKKELLMVILPIDCLFFGFFNIRKWREKWGIARIKSEIFKKSEMIVVRAYQSFHFDSIL